MLLRPVMFMQKKKQEVYLEENMTRPPIPVEGNLLLWQAMSVEFVTMKNLPPTSLGKNKRSLVSF